MTKLKMCYSCARHFDTQEMAEHKAACEKRAAEVKKMRREMYSRTCWTCGNTIQFENGDIDEMETYHAFEHGQVVGTIEEGQFYCSSCKPGRKPYIRASSQSGLTALGRAQEKDAGRDGGYYSPNR